MFRRSCGGRIMARDSLWPVSSIPCAAGGTWNLPLQFFLSSIRLDRPIYYVAPGMVMCLPGVGILAVRENPSPDFVHRAACNVQYIIISLEMFYDLLIYLFIPLFIFIFHSISTQSMFKCGLQQRSQPSSYVNANLIL